MSTSAGYFKCFDIDPYDIDIYNYISVFPKTNMYMQISGNQLRATYHHFSPLVQADGEVQLQDDWVQPTRETEPEDGGKVQNPVDGDTFQNLFGQLSYQDQTSSINGYLAQSFHVFSPHH